jgi:hypothetical protein
MPRPDAHVFSVSHAEYLLILSGLGLEHERWLQRARGQKTDGHHWRNAVGQVRACEDLKEKLAHHAKRGREKKRVGSAFTDYQAERFRPAP